MKATIDFDERLYRRLKIEAARRNRTIRELVDEGVRRVLGLPVQSDAGAEAGDEAWFGSLSGYAGEAEGAHDLASIRGSITRGRGKRS